MDIGYQQNYVLTSPLTDIVSEDDLSELTSRRSDEFIASTVQRTQMTTGVMPFDAFLTDSLLCKVDVVCDDYMVVAGGVVFENKVTPHMNYTLGYPVVTVEMDRPSESRPSRLYCAVDITDQKFSIVARKPDGENLYEVITETKEGGSKEERYWFVVATLYKDAILMLQNIRGVQTIGSIMKPRTIYVPQAIEYSEETGKMVYDIKRLYIPYVASWIEMEDEMFPNDTEQTLNPLDRKGTYEIFTAVPETL